MIYGFSENAISFLFLQIPFLLKLSLLFHQIIDALKVFPIISPNILIIFNRKVGVGKQHLLSEAVSLSVSFLTILPPVNGFCFSTPTDEETGDQSEKVPAQSQRNLYPPNASLY